jgi:hypothetical protein
MANDMKLPARLTRSEQIERAKALARHMVATAASDDLEKLFSFADSEWPFDYALKMTFFDEIHNALTARRNSAES